MKAKPRLEQEKQIRVRSHLKTLKGYLLSMECQKFKEKRFLKYAIFNFFNQCLTYVMQLDKPVNLPDVMSQVADSFQQEQNIDEMLKTMTKLKIEGDPLKSQTSFNTASEQQQTQEQSDSSKGKQKQSSNFESNIKNQEEEKEIKTKSRISTAKSTTSSTSQKSLANSQSIARNASNNFGPALNRHLPIVLPLIKRKQDLASLDRIHDLKDTLISNGGEEARVIIDKFELK